MKFGASAVQRLTFKVPESCAPCEIQLESLNQEGAADRGGEQGEMRTRHTTGFGFLRVFEPVIEG